MPDHHVDRPPHQLTPELIDRIPPGTTTHAAGPEPSQHHGTAQRGQAGAAAEEQLGAASTSQLTIDK